MGFFYFSFQRSFIKDFYEKIDSEGISCFWPWGEYKIDRTSECIIAPCKSEINKSFIVNAILDKEICVRKHMWPITQNIVSSVIMETCYVIIRFCKCGLMEEKFNDVTWLKVDTNKHACLSLKGILNINILKLLVFTSTKWLDREDLFWIMSKCWFAKSDCSSRLG